MALLPPMKRGVRKVAAAVQQQPALPCNYDSLQEPKKQDKGGSDDDGDDEFIAAAALQVARIIFDRWYVQKNRKDGV